MIAFSDLTERLNRINFANNSLIISFLGYMHYGDNVSESQVPQDLIYSFKQIDGYDKVWLFTGKKYNCSQLNKLIIDIKSFNFSYLTNNKNYTLNIKDLSDSDILVKLLSMTLIDNRMYLSN